MMHAVFFNHEIKGVRNLSVYCRFITFTKMSRAQCKNRLTRFYWFGLGLWVNFPRYVLVWAATEDILTGSLYSTAIVLVLYTVPEIFSKVVSPWILSRISFLPAFIVYPPVIFAVQSIFVFVNDINVRLVDMCVLGMANAFGTITTVKFLGFYSENAGVYSSGENCATFFASMFYTGLTTWVCVSPRIAIAILSPLYLFPSLIYALIDKKPLEATQNSGENVIYQAVANEDKEQQKRSAHSGNERTKAPQGFRQQFKLMYNQFLVNYSMAASSFLPHLSIAVILPTLTFKSSPFLPRDHYSYYRFLSDLGLMIGGIEVSLVSFLCPRFLDTIKIRRIWILILIGIGFVFLYLSDSWYHYIESYYIIFVLCFTQGVVIGCNYVNCYCLSADLFPDSRKLGKVLGHMEVSSSFGSLSAGILGMFVEEYLRKHCMGRLLLGRFCLTRLRSSGMWSTSNCEH